MLLQVAQSAQFPEGIRQLAAEFLVTLCEARERAPGMMRKLPQYISQLFSCMLLFLLDVTVSFQMLCAVLAIALTCVHEAGMQAVSRNRHDVVNLVMCHGAACIQGAE